MWARRVPDEGRPGPGAADRSYTLAHVAEVRGVARKLFEEIRDADYEQFLSADSRAPEAESHTESTAVSSGAREDPARVSCRTFRGCPIRSIWVGDAYIDGKSRPCVPYRLELSDGGGMSGNLAFEYLDLGGGGRWHPVEGIDWLLGEAGS